MPSMKSLRRLLLKYNSIGEGAAQALELALRRLPSFRLVDLTGNPIGASACRKIFDSSTSCT